MASTKSSPSPAVQEKRWRAESDLRTLSEAQEIQRDRSRVTAARRMATKQMTSLRTITGRKR